MIFQLHLIRQSGVNYSDTKRCWHINPLRVLRYGASKKGALTTADTVPGRLLNCSANRLRPSQLNDTLSVFSACPNAACGSYQLLYHSERILLLPLAYQRLRLFLQVCISRTVGLLTLLMLLQQAKANPITMSSLKHASRIFATVRFWSEQCSGTPFTPRLWSASFRKRQFPSRIIHAPPDWFSSSNSCSAKTYWCVCQPQPLPLSACHCHGMFAIIFRN